MFLFCQKSITFPNRAEKTDGYSLWKRDFLHLKFWKCFVEVLQSEKQVRMCWCFFTGDKIISFDFFLSFFVHWVIGMKRKVKNSEYAQKHFFSFINTFQFFKSKTFWLQELRNVERLFWKHFSHQTRKENNVEQSE